VEVIVALVYAFWRKRPRTKLLTIVLMINLITQPVLWIIRNCSAILERSLTCQNRTSQAQ
jgi:hypothetical protein